MKQQHLLLFFLFSLHLSAQNLSQLNKQLSTDDAKIMYWYDMQWSDKSSRDINALDSLETANMRFEKHLLQALNNNPETLLHNFDTIIAATTSPDKKLKAYSWDTFMGGTMKDYQTIFQYQTKVGVKAEKLTRESGNPDGEIYLCDTIYSFKTSQQTVYIAVISGTESTLYRWIAVKFFMIVNDRLVEAPSFIDTDDTGSQPGIEYIAFSGEDRNAPEKLIDFDPETLILRFARTDEKENVLNMFDRYKFNGSYFEKMKQ